jgi:hypothetical protein
MNVMREKLVEAEHLTIYLGVRGRATQHILALLAQGNPLPSGLPALMQVIASDTCSSKKHG